MRNMGKWAIAAKSPLTRRAATVLACAALAHATPARASDESKGKEVAPSSITALVGCRAIPNTADRLACFDRHAAIVDEQLVKRDIVVADRETMRETRRRLFGFALPRLRLFSGETDEEDRPTEITAQVDSAWISGGRMKIRLTDGAVWQQIGTDLPRRFPTQGTQAVIRQALMGTYFARFDGQRGVRMQRVE